MSETRPTLAPADDARAQLYAMGWWLQQRAHDAEADLMETYGHAYQRLQEARKKIDEAAAVKSQREIVDRYFKDAT